MNLSVFGCGGRGTSFANYQEYKGNKSIWFWQTLNELTFLQHPQFVVISFTLKVFRGANIPSCTQTFFEINVFEMIRHPLRACAIHYFL